MLFPTFLQKPGKKFSPADQEDRRRGGQPEKAVQQAAKGGADQAEVEDGPHSQPGGHVQPDPSVPQGQGAGKEDAGGGQPEEKIGQGRQPPGQGGEPEGAEQVVKQAQPDPGGQGEGQGVGLGGGGEGHPRKRRARKETGSSGSW